MNLTTLFLICILAVVGIFLAWFIPNFICYARTEDPNFRTYPEQFSAFLNKAKQRISELVKIYKAKREARQQKRENKYLYNRYISAKP